MVCENVTGQRYDQFAIEYLLKPLGIEKWWFEILKGDEKHGDHASHTAGLPARGTVLDTSLELWHKVLDTNLTTRFRFRR